MFIGGSHSPKKRLGKNVKRANSFADCCFHETIIAKIIIQKLNNSWVQYSLWVYVKPIRCHTLKQLLTDCNRQQTASHTVPYKRCMYVDSETEGILLRCFAAYSGLWVSVANCSFPFTYDGSLHYGCVRDTAGLTLGDCYYWCLTATKQMAICQDDPR